MIVNCKVGTSQSIRAVFLLVGNTMLLTYNTYMHGNAVIQPQRVVTATVRIDHKKLTEQTAHCHRRVSAVYENIRQSVPCPRLAAMYPCRVP